MNIAIFGFGTSGKYCCNILENYKNVKNIFIIDRIKLKITNTKLQQITLKTFLNKRKEIDAAIICTPSSEHYKYAKICLENNIKVLIEKPFTLQLTHAKQLINLAKKKKLKCWTILQNRYNLAINKMLKLTKEIGLDSVSFVDCSLYWHRSKKYYLNNWRGKYSSDGGVLTNQAIHLLDMLIYTFGEIKSFNVLAGYNKKKLQAEDLITVNFLHKNNIISSFKATTRADRNYEASIDILSNKKRFKVRGISLNSFHYWDKKKFIKDTKNSENFSTAKGQFGGMGDGHKKILKEFLNKKIKLSSKNLEISKNLYVLKVIHSIYNDIFKSKKKYKKISDKQSILGK